MVNISRFQTLQAIELRPTHHGYHIEPSIHDSDWEMTRLRCTFSLGTGQSTTVMAQTPARRTHGSPSSSQSLPLHYPHHAYIVASILLYPKSNVSSTPPSPTTKLNNVLSMARNLKAVAVPVHSRVIPIGKWKRLRCPHSFSAIVMKPARKPQAKHTNKSETKARYRG